jgi:hypothetical protein
MQGGGEVQAGPSGTAASACGVKGGYGDFEKR